jgi:hypothetical protein
MTNGMMKFLAMHLQRLSSQGDKNEIQNKVLKRKLISIFFLFCKVKVYAYPGKEAEKTLR